MTNLVDMPKFLAVDFYCGAGGTTRGLLDAGGYVIAGIDKEEACHKTYRRNNRNTMLDGKRPKFVAKDMFPCTPDYPQGQQGEILDKLRGLISYYRRMAAGVPLMFAICAPCQSFTKFIQHKMTDERTKSRERDQDLLAQTVRSIKEFKPEMIVSENVASIGRGSYKQIWDDFQRNLRDYGYAVGDGRVCASRFGVPQYRRRSILMAIRKDQDSNWDVKLPVPSQARDAPPLPSVRATIDHLPSLQAGGRHPSIPNHLCRNLAEVNRQRLMSVKPGEPNFGFAESDFGDLSVDCHRRLAAKGKRGFGDVYTRIHPDRPSPTITTRFHSVSNGRFGHYDEAQVRGLSLHEGALLQSFPEDYEFYGTGMDSIAKMIGNAVPPKLSEYMATWIYGLWTDNAKAAVVD